MLVNDFYWSILLLQLAGSSLTILTKLVKGIMLQKMDFTPGKGMYYM